MDLLGQYDSGNDGSDGEPAVAPDTSQILRPLKQSVSAAPDVSTVGMALVAGSAVPQSETSNFIDPGKRVVYYNMKYDDMHEPVAGPAHPYQKDGVAAGQKNHKLGFVEDSHLSSFMFDEQYQTFHSHGYAADPSGQHYVGDGAAYDAMGGGTVYQTGAAKRKKKRQKVAAGEEEGDMEGEEWGITRAMPWAEKGGPEPQELTEEQKEYLAAHRAKKGKKGGAADEGKDKEDQSVFHGKEEKDYQGRAWIEAPKDLKKQNDQCFIPKRWVHTWSGHTKGVSAIRFFPTTGHLLLSAGMDSKVKIWDVNGSGKCMRTYMGHSKAVRDICFSNDGRKFLTASYDKQIKLWDTETGQVLGSYSTGKIPFCVKFHPSNDKQNTILAGMSDKKIVQWDTSTGDQTQEYDQHLGAVNTITFVDNNRRFVTSSDDKTLRVWEFGIPVVIKYIAEPHMHSMPSIAVHPNGNWFVGQSLDNQILTYSTKERFRINRKKTFKGHTNAGYACQVAFSPDGRFVMSGDADGKCWFWDWKTTKVFRTLKAHEGVCIGAQWHPLETSKVATCGWDGAIKYWD